MKKTPTPDTIDIARLAEIADLNRKLKAQYKRAKAAEDRNNELVASVQLLRNKCERATEKLYETQDHERRLFVMLENALELATKTA